MNIKISLLLLFTFLFTGCGGGSSGDSLGELVTTVIQDRDEDDYLRGIYNPYGIFMDTEVRNLFIIDENSGEFTARYLSGGVFVTGEYYNDSSSNDRYGTISDSAKFFELDSETNEFTPVDGDIGLILRYNLTETSSFSWEIQEANQSVLLTQELQYPNDISREFIVPAKYSFISGNYTTEIYYGAIKYTLSFSIDSDGDISGTDTESCVISGKADIGNENINSYILNVTMDNCLNSLNNGSYTGLMALNGYEGEINTLTDRLDIESQGLMIMIHNQQRAIDIQAIRN